jgi:hypothetical protein
VAEAAIGFGDRVLMKRFLTSIATFSLIETIGRNLALAGVLTLDVLTRAACDFEDDARQRQGIAKDIENEIAITKCRRRVPAVIGHLRRTFNFALPRLRHALSLQRFPLIRFEASTARPHCRIIVAPTRPLGT